MLRQQRWSRRDHREKQEVLGPVAVTIRPIHFSREVGANQDGTIFVKTKAEPGEAEMSLSDKCGLKLDELMDQCWVDVTIRLVDMRKTYLFTQASIVGRPEIDSESGEIKGLKIASARVRMITN